MAEENKDQWMAIGEAAKFLSISRDTLRRWEKAGKIKPVRSPSNRRYYTKNQLGAIMSGQKAAPARKIQKTKRSLNKKTRVALSGTVSFVLAILIGLAVVFFLL